MTVLLQNKDTHKNEWRKVVLLYPLHLVIIKRLRSNALINKNDCSAKVISTNH